MKSEFLTQQTEKKKFSAWDIINLLIFAAVLSFFVIDMIFVISGFIKGNPAYDVMALVQRIGMTVLCFLPAFLKYVFKINFPKIVTICFYIFLFLSVWLGTFRELYSKTTYYDDFVHFLSGVLIALFALFILQLYAKNKKDPVDKWFVFVFVVVFAIAIGTFWEIFEFLMDLAFDANMQKYITENGIIRIGRDALFDTMLDTIDNTLGAILVGITSVLILRKNPKFLSNFKITKEKRQKIAEIEE